MVNAEALEARVSELSEEIESTNTKCNEEATRICYNQNWSGDFAEDFKTFLYDKKYKAQLEEKQKEYDMLKKYIVE